MMTKNCVFLLCVPLMEDNKIRFKKYFSEWDFKSARATTKHGKQADVGEYKKCIYFFIDFWAQVI